MIQLASARLAEVSKDTELRNTLPEGHIEKRKLSNKSSIIDVWLVRRSRHTQLRERGYNKMKHD